MPQTSYETIFETDGSAKLKKPNMYAVIMHNDSYTTMDFVIEILINIFHKPLPQAHSLMMQVHNEGEGIAGVYPYDIAVSKRLQAEKYAEESGFPLKLSVRVT